MQEVQAKVRKFIEKYDLKMPLENWYFDLVSELGELGKEFNKGSKYGKIPHELTKNFELEIGDILYSLLGLANQANLDLESCLNRVLTKYEERYNKKGKISSS